MTGSRDGTTTRTHPAAVAVLAAVLAAGGTGGAGAQSVQTCIAADGHVTLTSDRCAPGERLAGSVAAVPEPERPQAAVPQARPGGAAPRRSAPSARGGARRAPDRCALARQERERTLQRVGLKRTFALLRALDEDVWQACR